MFIDLRASPRAPPMPKLTETDDWVSALRTFIRDQLGNKNWKKEKEKEIKFV